MFWVLVSIDEFESDESSFFVKFVTTIVFFLKFERDKSLMTTFESDECSNDKKFGFSLSKFDNDKILTTNFDNEIFMFFLYKNMSFTLC